MSDGARMRWASAHSLQSDGIAAATEVAAAVAGALGGATPDLCLAFLSALHVRTAAPIVATLREALRPGCFAATSARGVVAGTGEFEQGVAVSVIAATLPGVEVSPFLLDAETWRAPMEDAEAFTRAAPGVAGAELVLLLADPFSLDVDAVFAQVHRHAPGVRVVGGMASAAVRPGGNVLALNDWLSAEGGVAIALAGALRVDVVVSQGCTPIGPPLDVTHVDRNLILTLDGQPALERVEQVLGALPESERERLQQGLYVGRPARGNAGGVGDYLIRNLLGADRGRGSIAVADVIAPREKIRLHVRDARAAIEDLEMLLSPQAFDGPAAAALAFLCNGRGRTLFGETGRDIGTLQEALHGPVPAAGMFCAGEFGPVGGRNFQHGHTASLAIVRPR